MPDKRIIYSALGGSVLLVACICLVFNLGFGRKSPNATSQSMAASNSLRKEIASETNANRRWERHSGEGKASIDEMFATLAKLSYGPQYQFKLREIAQRYAETEPDKGFLWLSSLPHDMENAVAFASFFGTLSMKNPKQAILWVEKIEFEGGRKAAAFSTAVGAAFANPGLGWELTTRWKGGFVDQKAAEGSVLLAISRAEGADGAWSVYYHGGNKPDSANIIPFFKAVKFESSREAVDFSLRKLPDDLQPLALESIVENWSPNSLSEISAELAARPVDSKFDNAYKALAMRVYVNDPVSAAQWSAVISDPAMRKNTQKSIIDYISRNDKALLQKVNEIINGGGQSAGQKRQQ